MRCTVSIFTSIFRDATSSALARPAIPVTFSVPARREPSWLPPVVSGRMRSDLFLYKKQTHFGP